MFQYNHDNNGSTFRSSQNNIQEEEHTSQRSSGQSAFYVIPAHRERSSDWRQNPVETNYEELTSNSKYNTNYQSQCPCSSNPLHFNPNFDNNYVRNLNSVHQACCDSYYTPEIPRYRQYNNSFPTSRGGSTEFESWRLPYRNQSDIGNYQMKSRSASQDHVWSRSTNNAAVPFRLFPEIDQEITRRGTVIKYVKDKHYGFIKMNDYPDVDDTISTNIFFHDTSILHKNDHDELLVGQNVRFNLVEVTNRGIQQLQAANIRGIPLLVEDVPDGCNTKRTSSYSTVVASSPNCQITPSSPSKEGSSSFKADIDEEQKVRKVDENSESESLFDVQSGTTESNKEIMEKKTEHLSVKTGENKPTTPAFDCNALKFWIEEMHLKLHSLFSEDSSVLNELIIKLENIKANSQTYQLLTKRDKGSSNFESNLVEKDTKMLPVALNESGGDEDDELESFDFN